MRKVLNKKLGVFIAFIVLLYIKTLLFTSIGSSGYGTTFGYITFNFMLMLTHLAILAILVFPALLFKEKGKLRYMIILDGIYSVLLIADLWYFRASGYFFGISYIAFPDLFNPLGNSLFNPMPMDLLFLIDMPIVIYLFNKNKNKYDEKRYIKTGIFGVLISICMVFGSHYLFDEVRVNSNVRFIQDDWEGSWSPSTRIIDRSPIGDFVYDAYCTIVKLNDTLDDEELDKIETWLEWNDEDLPDNEYKGIAEGKNVIFVQVESLENFMINQEIYGQEITPNLNKLVSEGLYFSNVYEQNNAANSIDCDTLVNSGVLTLGDAVTFLKYPEVKYNSLANILGNLGYTTVSSRAEKDGDWNWLEAHKAGLGFQTSWDVSDYSIDEYVGYGLSDRSFYTQFAEKLTSLQDPFFASIATLSSHGPFDIAEQYRELDLPEDLDSNRLGGYLQSVHYADEQLGMFIDLLEESGLMDDTILVIYGDHGGVHKYYMEDVEESDIPGDWWQEKNDQIPLIIYGADIPAETIETTGGHIDIMPTVAYVLGADTDNTQMGRNLLNTNRDASVIKGGTVVGNPTEEDEEMFGMAYDIADLIIKNNYYVKTNKVD